MQFLVTSSFPKVHISREKGNSSSFAVFRIENEVYCEIGFHFLGKTEVQVTINKTIVEMCCNNVTFS